MFRLYVIFIIASSYSVDGWGPYGIDGNKEACYGDEFTMPISELGYLQVHSFFFTPAKGGKKIQILKDGEPLDYRHYDISSSRQLIIREVTERDEGVFSTEFPSMSDITLTKIALKVIDCSAKVTKDYGSDYYFSVPDSAYSLEFSPLNSPNIRPVLLWNNRTGVRETAGRGRLVNKEWQMERLTPEYNGYYTFRNQKRELISTNKMTVEAQTNFFVEVEGMDVGLMEFNLNGMELSRFDLTFHPTNDPEPVVLMKAGNLQPDWETDFSGRIQVDGGRYTALEILLLNVQPSDSGQYKLIDQEGHPYCIVELNVEEINPPYFIYVVLAAGILSVLLICCCCVKKCCKKTTRKQDVHQTEAAPAVYYYDDNTQPSSSALPTSSYGPTNSYPLYPIEPGPGSTHHQALISAPENQVGSSQPEVAFTASHEPASTTCLGVDTLSSDAEPQFELKGIMFSSASPLSSQASYNDVYSSDKLNFL